MADVDIGSPDWIRLGDCVLEQSSTTGVGVGVVVVELIIEVLIMQEPVKDPLVVSLG